LGGEFVKDTGEGGARIIVSLTGVVWLESGVDWEEWGEEEEKTGEIENEREEGGALG